MQRELFRTHPDAQFLDRASQGMCQPDRRPEFRLAYQFFSAAPTLNPDRSDDLLKSSIVSVG
jgi:hypothetical protein